MKKPKIEFVSLNNTTEDALIEFMRARPYQSVFLVYLRQRYRTQDRWEYIIDCCSLMDFDRIEWNYDWWEGQKFVEYLAVTNITEGDI